MKHTTRRTLSTALLSLATFALPAAAHAQFRATAHVGVEHLARSGASTTMLQLRAEAMVRSSPWLDLGGYAQRLDSFEAQNAQAGWGLGALATLRPLSSTEFGPIAYGSVGYQRAPEGAIFRDGLFLELGGGLAWRPASVLDLELRGGFVGLVGGERDLTGFTAGFAVSLHP